MATRMQQRRGTAAQWTSADPILAAGEIGFESDTGQFKIGDGVNHWEDLSYFKNLEDLGGSLDDYVPVDTKGQANGVASLDSSGKIPVAQLGNLIDGAPDALNTLNELAAAINDDGTFASTIVSALSGKLALGGGTMTGSINMSGNTISNVLVPAPTIDSNPTTKGYVDSGISTHNSATTNVHGIADTAALATTAATASAISTSVSNHNALTANVHGIADTTVLATATTVATAKSEAITEAGTAADTKISTAVAALTKSSVGLANVDNTSDANKPVSTATQTALDAKASLAGAIFTGNVEVDGNLVVDGDFTVNGTNFSASATSIVIEDNIVQLAHENPANTVDLGLVVAYNDGAAKHAGLVRDASDDEWKLFKGVTSEPTTTVNFAQGSLDNLELNNLVAAGVVFTDGTQTKEGVVSRTPIIAKTDSYTLSALTERDSLIEVAKSSATTITIPLNSAVAYPVGTSLDILQTGTGQVTIAGAAGVTVNATPGLKLRTQWSSATLFKRAENTWVVYGDLMA
jgi:hypothetical protein